MILINNRVDYFIPRSDMPMLPRPQAEFTSAFNSLQLPVSNIVRDIVWGYIWGRVHNYKLGFQTDAKHL